MHPRTRAVPDPVKAARDKHQAEAICAAYNDNIPGVPNACKK